MSLDRKMETRRTRRRVVLFKDAHTKVTASILIDILDDKSRTRQWSICTPALHPNVP